MIWKLRGLSLMPEVALIVPVVRLPAVDKRPGNGNPNTMINSPALHLHDRERSNAGRLSPDGLKQRKIRLIIRDNELQRGPVHHS